MKDEEQIRTLLERLKLPPQDLTQLSFCGGNRPAKVRDWVESLPVMRISYVCSLLYQSLPEIARLKVAPDPRLEMLEHLRPAVHQALQGLSNQFFNQPVILPDPARKAATVAQALQKHMANGYLVTARDMILSAKADSDLGEPLALAIHRGLTGLGLLLLRCYQLYLPVPERLWQELHGLYLLAERLQLHRQSVPDPMPHHSELCTIERSYLRLLLLASAHPNQLRQEEVNATYNALEELAPLAQLTPYRQEQQGQLFVVDLDSDQGPQYRSRLSSQAREIRGLDASQLVVSLEAEHPDTSRRSAGARNNYGLLAPLNEHLIKSWHLLAQRSFERQTGGGQLEVTVGLSNLHFHLAEQTPFKLFLDRGNATQIDDADLFSKLTRANQTKSLEDEDPWGEAFDAGGSRMAGSDLPSLNIERDIRQRQQREYQGEHPTYLLPVVDISPGGYRLEWREQIPSQVKAGELLGVREEGRLKWSLAVVRWVQQTKGATLLGLQTIAPQATPMGAAIVYKTGGYSEYLRALQVPALKALGQPPTLITNAVSFHEYCKLRLFRPASAHSDAQSPSESNVQLTRKRFSTGAVSQFEFRELASASNAEKDPLDESD